MMNLETYIQLKRKRTENEPKYRTLCMTCRQPEFSCFCEHVHAFDSKIVFVILTHPIEVKRRIATGRMSHLCLKNSHLLAGQDYTEDKALNSLLADPKYDPVILYPGRTSIDISKRLTTETTSVENSQPEELLSPSFGPEKAEASYIDIFEKGKIPLLVVIDGTWSTARKTAWQSQNLKTLRRICFTPRSPSNFRVRKQPAEGCYSTIEAIHESIDLLGPSVGFDIKTGAHHRLIEVFDVMVERQLDHIKKRQAGSSRHTFRREKANLATSKD
jgi:DTW domain-containing protein